MFKINSVSELESLSQKPESIKRDANFIRMLMPMLFH